ncbi:hypothetical protein BBJ28_00003716 [Nothophytophthora sp. Chile5]|nr:hypothetical protein BBJ28_00003716 [Nothophytophthora sp. Chile5]
MTEDKWPSDSTTEGGKMVARIAFRRALLRQIRGPPRRAIPTVSVRCAAASVTGLRARYFAVWASNDVQTPTKSTQAKITSSWRRSRSTQVENSLPIDRSDAFYDRQVMEALESDDLHGAMAIAETLHRRFPNRPVLAQDTYNLLLFHLSGRQRALPNAHLKRILALLDTMISVDRVDTRSFHSALVACSRARHLRSAQKVMKQMRASGLKPGPFAYAGLLHGCARKRGRVATAERYFDEMLSDGFKPNARVVNAMLRVYARASGRSQRMLALLQRVRDEFQVQADTFTTRTVVLYLLSESNPTQAVAFLQDVMRALPPTEEEPGLPLQFDVGNALLDACRQRSDWGLAQDALALLKSAKEVETPSAKARRDVEDRAELESLIAEQDADAAPVVWDPEEREFGQMTRAQENTFRLALSRKQSIEHAAERVRRLEAGAALTGVDRRAAMLSLKLEGKMTLLDAMIRDSSANAADFNAVLSACGRQGRLEEAEVVLDKMKRFATVSPDCAPTTWSYNAVLNACAVRGAVRQVEAIVNGMLERDLEPDHVTMNTVLKAHVANLTDGAGGSPHARLKTAMQALSFFEWCTEEQAVEPDAATYFTLFRLFAEYTEERDEDSEDIEEDDEDDDDEDEEQQTELGEWAVEFISSTCRDAPLAVIDVGVFNAGFDYFQRLGDVKQAFALFNVMKQRGFPPDDNTLGLLFAACARAEQAEVGLNFLDHLMGEEGYEPSLKVLNGAIRLCANSNNPHGAMELFRAIQASGTFQPTIETYEPVVHAFARVGNVADAWSFANEMEQQLGKVSVSIYNRVLQACAVAARPGPAMEILEHMRRKHGAIPDVTSYNMVLEAFVAAGKRAAWRRNQKEEEEDYDGFDEDEEDDDPFLEGGQGGDRADGHDTEPLYDHQDSFVEEASAPQDGDFQHREDAERVRITILSLLEEMRKSKRSRPDSLTYRRAIAACDVRDDPEGVISIFDELLVHDKGEDDTRLKEDVVTDPCVSAYLAACLRLHETERVTQVPQLLHKRHTATGQSPSLQVLLELLDALEGVGEWRRAVRLLPNLQTQFGMPPNVLVFNRVMQLCNRAGEHQLVAPIFATMQDATVYRVFPDVDSYIQMIYAEEQRENWAAATDLFVEMQNKCPSEEISPRRLQKIALGRYRLRQQEL